VSDQPGKLIGSGRAADVYDLGDGTVLRRYRSRVGDVEREAEVMRYVRSHGFPAPTVFSAAGTDLVMEKIEGRTMMAKLVESPASVYSHGRLLARLLSALGEISAPDWLMAPGFAAHPSGDRVLHLDLHPMNVMITEKGPIVIDWTNAAGGPAGFDSAMTYVESEGVAGSAGVGAVVPPRPRATCAGPVHRRRMRPPAGGPGHEPGGARRCRRAAGEGDPYRSGVAPTGVHEAHLTEEPGIFVVTGTTTTVAPSLRRVWRGRSPQPMFGTCR
jgi:aminoglycoside phosphotransferase (APT) family kinase protein